MFFDSTKHEKLVVRLGVSALLGTYGCMAVLVSGQIPSGFGGLAYVSAVACAGVTFLCGLLCRGRALKLALILGALIFFAFLTPLDPFAGLSQ